MVTAIKGNDTSTFGGTITYTAPAFRAYPSSAQNISTTTFVKMALNAETFDTDSCYDNSTYRFTPTTAGYYLVTLSGYLQSLGDNDTHLVSIYKNGSEYTRGTQIQHGGVADSVCVATALVYCNGSTDYIEFYQWHNYGADRTMLAQSNTSSASAHLARAV
jgi:hypothetical protein